MSYLPPEQVVVDYLTGTCGLRLVTVQDPDNLLDLLPVAKVTRVGGGDDYVTEDAMIHLHVFNTTRATALDTATQVHTRMRQLRGQRVGGCLIDHVHVDSGPSWEDYADENVKRYVAIYTISTRLGFPLSVVAS